jgi:hypothetical protein
VSGKVPQSKNFSRESLNVIVTTAAARLWPGAGAKSQGPLPQVTIGNDTNTVTCNPKPVPVYVVPEPQQ